MMKENQSIAVDKIPSGEIVRAQMIDGAGIAQLVNYWAARWQRENRSCHTH